MTPWISLFRGRAGIVSLSFPLLGAVLAPATLAQQPPPRCRGPLVYFASNATGSGAGIAAARFDNASGRLCPLGLSATIEKPTWTLADPTRPILYALSETRGEGRGVWVYRIDPRSGGLRLISHADTGGAEPAFLSIDARSQTLFAAHWGSGDVSTVPIGDDGTVGQPASIQRATGSGPRPGQGGPRAHAALLDPARRLLAVADFGSDRLSFYRFDGPTRLLTQADPPFVRLPPGSGPRHLVFDRSGRFLYLVDQLSSDVTVFGWAGAAIGPSPLQVLSTVASGFVGANDAAEIALSSDGRHLYVSNRGEDTIVAYAVDAKTGRLTERQRIASGGKIPRSFAFDPSGRWLLVANQNSDEVSVFLRDRRTGMLRPSASRLGVAGVAGITFAKTATAGE